MSDKNFKVKNGLDANGAVTITQPTTSTVPLTILANTLATGSNLLEVKRPDGTVRLSIGNDGSFSAQSLVAYNVRFYSAQTVAQGLIIRGLPSQTANLQEWRDINETVLASVSASGSISAVDLTLSGNLTVNGTTTNLNSTNLIIEDKNIIIADVATPTDTTADGAGITIKGATDKTLNWVQSTGSFTSSEPLIVNTNSITRPNLIVKSIASQSANLQEWQNISGTVLASVESGGAFNISPTSTPNGYSLYVIGAGSSGIITMKSTATSAHAIQLQNSSNTIVFKMDLEGRIVPSSTSSIGLIVRGLASQSADLQQWQNSAGTILAQIDSNGRMTADHFKASVLWNNFIVNYDDNGPYFNMTSTNVLLQNRNTTSNVLFTIKGMASQTGDLQQWQRSDGFTLLSVSKDGDVTAGSGSSTAIRFRYFDGINISGTYWDTVATNSATFIGRSTTAATMVVKAAASQTANLQEWQNSGGAVLSAVGSGGAISVNSSNGTPTGLAGQGALEVKRTAYFDTGSAANIGIIVRARSSQTANLQEWQNSSGTVLANVDSAGFVNGSAYRQIGGNSNGFGIGTISSVLTAFGSGGNATVVPVVVRGASGQTANLQEWQDSTGAVIAKLDPAGGFTTGTPATTNIKLDATAAGAKLHFGIPATVNNYATLGAYSSVFNIEANARSILATVTNSTTTTTLIVKANTSQTANLQEWQNSAGTSLVSVQANGRVDFQGAYIDQYGQIITNTTLYANNVYHNLNYWQLKNDGSANFNSQSATTKPLIVKGAASQTANLQEWQNSSGTVYAKVTKDFDVFAGGFINNGLTSGYAGGDNVLNNLGIQASSFGLSYFRVKSGSAGAIVAVIDGATSQTGDLTQWRNSAGTVLAKVDSDGNLILGNQYISNSGASGYGRLRLLDGGTNETRLEPFTQGFLISNPGSTGMNVVKIRGTSGQTGDLQQWQNSAGTVLASISPTGKLTSAVDASINGVVIGMGAGSVSSNTSVGLNSLVSNTTGTYNTAFGNQSLQLNTSGTQNTAFGQNALYNNRTGWYNTAFGQGALQNNNYAYSNTAIGTAAMISNVSGSGNTAVGIQSLLLNSSGGNNVGIGQNAGFSNSTGSGNIFLGSEAGYYETGSNKLYIANTNTTTPLIGGDFSAKTLTFAGNATITSQTTGTVGLVVKGAASQTANLQEWQNSSGTLLSAIDKAGNLTKGDGDQLVLASQIFG